MAAICQEKIATLNNIVEYTDFFFKDIEAYEEKGVRKQFQKPDALQRMIEIDEALHSVSDWNHDAEVRLRGAGGENRPLFGRLRTPDTPRAYGKERRTRLVRTGGVVGKGSVHATACSRIHQEFSHRLTPIGMM